jgi:hypothetical protein
VVAHAFGLAQLGDKVGARRLLASLIETLSRVTLPLVTLRAATVGHLKALALQSESMDLVEVLLLRLAVTPST